MADNVVLVALVVNKLVNRALCANKSVDVEPPVVETLVKLPSVEKKFVLVAWVKIELVAKKFVDVADVEVTFPR